MAILKGLEGKSENEKVHSLAGVDIVGMTQSHIMYVAFQIYMKSINEAGAIKCPNLKAILDNLARLFALTELQQDSAACYEAGFLGQGSGSVLLDAQKQLMIKLRPQMIPLIESWEFPDSVLVSAIGNSYGDIYETQLEWARNSRLNKSPVPKGFKEYMEPILTGKL